MERSFFGTTHMRALGALTLLMVIIALASYARLNFEKVNFVSPTPATISVSGEGEVFAVPDIGQFSFSVTAEAETATAAQEQSATRVNEILAYLDEQGIEEKDIKNQNYYLNPRYRYEERICQVGSYCPPGNRVQDGFEVSQTILVKVRDTAKAGSIITGVGERGATNISNLSFTIDDMDEIRATARAQAIDDAQTKADLLSKQLGVQLVQLVSYSENNGYQPYFDARMATMEESESDGLGGASLPVGEESTIVRVNLTYQIK